MSRLRLLLAGLGNPGEKYRRTRHNAGFLLLDRFAEREFAPPWSRKGEALATSLAIERAATELELVLIKPQNFMNRSGGAVVQQARQSKLPGSSILVLHDEIELPFGELRHKFGGGHKGHNGLRDIIARGGSPDFHRLRIGVDRPEHGEVADYLLSPFRSEEWQSLDEIFERGLDEINRWLIEQIEESKKGEREG